MNILNISMLHILNICTCTHKKKVGSQEKVTSATISGWGMKDHRIQEPP